MFEKKDRQPDVLKYVVLADGNHDTHRLIAKPRTKPDPPNAMNLMRP